MRQKRIGTLIPKINNKPISEFMLQYVSRTFSAHLMTVQIHPKRNSGHKDTWRDFFTIFLHRLYKTVVRHHHFTRNQCSTFQECQTAKQGTFLKRLVMSEVAHMNLRVFLLLMYYIRFTSITLNSKLRTNVLCKSTLHARLVHCSPRHCNVAHSCFAEQICLSFIYLFNWEKQIRRKMGQPMAQPVWHNQFLVGSTIRSCSSNHFYFHSKLQKGHWPCWSSVSICSYRTQALIVTADSFWTLAKQIQNQNFINNALTETIFSYLRSLTN